MGEDAGGLSVTYTIVSDAAMRRLERLQHMMDKVAVSAEKQGQAIEAAYKKAGKIMVTFGAVTTGVLYGIIRASAYSSMWLDQISHQMTRISTKILEILGLDESIEFFIKLLGGIADQLEAPADTPFWKNLAGDFWDLSLKAKIATIILVGLGAALTILSLVGIVAFLSKAGAALVSAGVATKLAAAGTWLLNGALAVLTSPITLVIIAVVALSVALLYLWSKTAIGKTQIEQLGKIWSTFKKNISEIGWKDAIINALKHLGEMGVVTLVWVTKKWYTMFTNFGNTLKTYMYIMGKTVVDMVVDGIETYFPGFSNTVYSIYDKFKEVLTYVKDYVFDLGKRIINRLVDGIKARFPWLKTVTDGLSALWELTGDKLTYGAELTGTKMVDNLADAAADAETTLGPPWERAGYSVKSGLERGIDGASGSVCDQVTGAYDCIDRGVDSINDRLDDIVSDIQIQANLAISAGEYVAGGWGWSLSGWKNTGGSGGGGGGGGGYTAASWSAGWMNSALGGHVDRTGSAVVHQGEDIVHLKSLLSGVDSKTNRSRGDITINPVINISSSNMTSDPFEASRVADVISKRMGEELRRITTNI